MTKLLSTKDYVVVEGISWNINIFPIANKYYKENPEVYLELIKFEDEIKANEYSRPFKEDKYPNKSSLLKELFNSKLYVKERLNKFLVNDYSGEEIHDKVLSCIITFKKHIIANPWSFIIRDIDTSHRFAYYMANFINFNTYTTGIYNEFMYFFKNTYDFKQLNNFIKNFPKDIIDKYFESTNVVDNLKSWRLFFTGSDN